LGLEKPNLGLDPGETFFPNSVSDLDSAETFQISRNLGLDIDENVCLLDSQPWIRFSLTALPSFSLAARFNLMASVRLSPMTLLCFSPPPPYGIDKIQPDGIAEI